MCATADEYLLIDTSGAIQAPLYERSDPHNNGADDRSEADHSSENEINLPLLVPISWARSFKYVRLGLHGRDIKINHPHGVTIIGS